MGILDKVLSGTVTEVIDKVNSVAHSWINTSKDKEEASQKETEFQLQVTQVLNEYNLKVQDLAEKELETYLKDTADARNREIQIATSDKAPWINKTILPFLALGVTLGFFGLLFYMLKFTTPEANKSVLDIMLGSLGTAWITIISYFFGSSAGSAAKDKVISNMTSK